MIFMWLSLAFAEPKWERCYPVHVSQEAYCTEVSTPLDPDNPNGELLTLSVIQLPAIRANAELDSVFVLAGGPGQGATETIATLYPALRKVHQRRTLVFIDQRGTGKSQPLNCDLPELSDSTVPIKELQECRNGLPHDPKWYQTRYLADDTDFVRRYLGYEAINLYGVSYGTRLAMTIARRYPSSVRTMVLDGVVPFQKAIAGNFGAGFRSSLENIFMDCSNDSECSSSFPKLREDYQSVVEELQSNQAKTITHPHPRTGKVTETKVSQDVFWGVLQQMLYSSSLSAMIPYAIHQIAEFDDWSTIIGWLDTTPFSDIPIGLYLSITCSEDVPRIDFTQAPPLDLGVSSSSQLQQMCEVWDTKPVDSDFFIPLKTSIPVLLMSGEMDPVTPPKYGDLVMSTLGNAKHLIVSGAAHNTIQVPCAQKVVTEFIEVKDPLQLSNTCDQEVLRTPFILSATGTTP